MMWIALVLLSLFSLSAAQISSAGSILQPPSITNPDRPQKKYFADGDRVVVKCEANGQPKPEYEWQRNNEIIESDEYIKFDSRTGTLEIPTFTDREEGVFVCRASNVVGGNLAVSFSHPQTILASRVTSFKKRDEPSPDINNNEYAYAMMRCSDQGEVVGGPSDISYKWYITQESRQVSPDDGRLFISSDGTLHFIYTLTKDELQGQDTYHCGISSLKSRLIRLGPPMILKVQESTPTALKPVMKYNNDGLEAILATSADLECVFSGYDPTSKDKLPVITWVDQAKKRIQVDGKKYKLFDKNRTLRIFDVQEEDDNNYGCQGTNSAGSSRIQFLHLNVTSPPIWKQAPESRTAPEGRDVPFYCSARSLSGEEPPLLPVWYVNGQSFEEVARTKTNIGLSDDKKTLIVANVSKLSDILCVQCIVSNSLGNTMGDACLNVINPIQITLTCDKCAGKSTDECNCQEWEISKGDAVQFKLSVTTDPGYVDKLTQQWDLHEDTYELPKLPPYWNRDPITQVYFFNTSDLSDKEFRTLDGSYQFRVYHAYDKQEKTFRIQVKGAVADTGSDDEPKAEPAVSSASVDMWIIGVVIGLVFLLIVIIVIIFVIVCRKQQEGVYNLGKKETGAGLDPAKELKDKAFHDLSRPDYEDYEYPDKKPKGELEYDDVPIGGDDESLGEYGDEDDLHFNEDGSFIGNYSVKPSSNNRTTESTI